MKNVMFAYEYEHESEAIFCCEEHGFAEHTHFRISKSSGLD